jgi:hypothetical protein
MTGLFRSSAAGRMDKERLALERASNPDRSRISTRYLAWKCVALGSASLGNSVGIGKSFA